MEWRIVRAWGQPNGGNNSTVVTNFMFSERMDRSSAQEIGLAYSLVLTFFLFILIFVPKLLPVQTNSKAPWHFSNLYWSISSVSVKVLLRWGDGGPCTYLLVFYLLPDFSPSLVPGWTGWRGRCWVTSYRAGLNLSELRVVPFQTTTIFYWQPHPTSAIRFLLWKKKDTHTHAHTHHEVGSLPLASHFSFWASLWLISTSLAKHNILYTIQYILSSLSLVKFFCSLLSHQNSFSAYRRLPNCQIKAIHTQL